MIDEKFDSLVNELRAGRPVAPDHLRRRVAAIAVRPQAPRERLRLRWVLAPSAAALVAGAIAIGVLSGGEGRPQQLATPEASRQAVEEADTALPAGAGAPVAPARRAQLYSAEITLRVKDLSDVTQDALRQTRALGGYVRRVDYGEGRGEGTARIVVRVPIERVQTAILRFSELGRILDQHVSVRDVQPRLDRRFQRIAELQRVIPSLSGEELAAARAELEALRAAQASDRRRTSFATVSLELTTQAEEAAPASPGRIERAFERAVDVLAAEAVGLVYATVVGAPLVVLAVAVLAIGRVARRRSDGRLLGY